MATISINETSGFFGIDEERKVPITISGTAGSPANATFHRIRWKVKIGSVDYEFAQPVTAGATVLIDISSAFISAYSSYEYTEDIPVGGYPTYTAEVQAVEDYMVDGVVREDMNPSEKIYVKACPGLLLDTERLYGVRPSRYSRKPTSSPEVCFTGSKYLVAGPTVEELAPKDPSCTEVTVVAGATAAYNIYGIEKPEDGYELRFVNSLRVHENIFVRCLRSAEVDIHTDKYTLARQETVSHFSRSIVRKSNDYERWKMSSGPLDEKWQSWYLHELLMADLVWIKIGNCWLPVHVVPEETTKGIDRTKAGALTVDFTLEFDIEGDPMSALAI